jgi:dethiobiotin synthetase
MRALFVTASGTGVGKTFVMRTLIGALRTAGQRVEALKPVISGWDPALVAESDAGLLLASLGRSVTPENVDSISPWRFTAPLSPDMAAAREGRSVDWDLLLATCRARLQPGTATLIEGIGGVMVPLDDRHTVLDWIAALEIPALLVTGSYLGSLSHTLTAAAVLRERSIATHVVVSESQPGPGQVQPVPLDETVSSLSRQLPTLTVAALRRTPDCSEIGPDAQLLARELITLLWG